MSDFAQRLAYHSGIMLDPAVGSLLVACFATLFATAGIHKLRDLARFDEVFTAYALLPRVGGLRTALLVPLLELAVALGLLGGISRGYAAAAGVALLIAYAGAIAVNLMRGRWDLDCGCGGPNGERKIAPWMVFRNVALAAVLTSILLPWNARPLTATDALTIGCGLVSASLLYLCLDRLLGPAGRRTTELRSPP
jgi:uncharacterized membrane protein YphA (DoxX/SURF4 family)